MLYIARTNAVARCPSVRLSVTRRYCVETGKVPYNIKLYSLWIAASFQFFYTKRYRNIPTWTLQTGTSNAGRV